MKMQSRSCLGLSVQLCLPWTYMRALCEEETRKTETVLCCESGNGQFQAGELHSMVAKEKRPNSLPKQVRINPLMWKRRNRSSGLTGKSLLHAVAKQCGSPTE
eukprot:3623593-Amphidinium_carterae.1